MSNPFKKSSNTTKSESAPWAPAQDQLKDILSEMQGWYNGAKDTGYISETGDLTSIYGDYLNSLGNTQGQVNEQLNGYLNQAQGLQGGAADFYKNMQNGGMNISAGDITDMAGQFMDSDLLKQRIGSVTDSINDAAATAYSQANRGNVSTGNLGSSRASITDSMIADNASKQITSATNDIVAQETQNALQNAMSTINNNNQMMMQGAGNAAQLGSQLYGQGGQIGNYLNQGNNLGLQGAQLQQMIQGAGQADKIGERDYLANMISQYYAPIVTGIGGMGGTSTQKTPGQSGIGGIMGGLGGVGGLMQGMGSMGLTFSDRRLKTNIKKVDEYDGFNIYTWDWNDEGQKLAGDMPGMGVIAQEVQEVYPEAVQMKDGYLQVDYSKVFA